MTDAEKLLEVAKWFQGAEKLIVEGNELLAWVADNLDLIYALRAGTWKAVPVEPTKAMETAGGWAVYPADGVWEKEIRGHIRCWRDMLSTAPAKPEG